MQQSQEQHLRKLKQVFRELHESQFLDTASGENIDKLSLVCGYERLPQETDADYRIRLYDLVIKNQNNVPGQ